MVHPVVHASGEQGVAVYRVVAEILQGVRNGLRHDDAAGEVHDRADPLIGKNPIEQRPIADRTDDKRYAFG